MEEKNLIKQIDILKLTDLIQVELFHWNLFICNLLFKDMQTKLSNLSDELLLNLLHIRIYFSLFRLGSNYTVQVY